MIQLHSQRNIYNQNYEFYFYITNDKNPVKFKKPNAIPNITLKKNLNQNILSSFSSLVDMSTLMALSTNLC